MAKNKFGKVLLPRPDLFKGDRPGTQLFAWPNNFVGSRPGAALEIMAQAARSMELHLLNAKRGK
jgi:hypothetical protein